MPILDDRGRLFGRVNLIDAAVVLVVLALVPLAYVSWAFLKVPKPILQEAKPAVLRAGVDDQRVQVTGQHLRPFLRVFADKTPVTYLFGSPSLAELRVPRLPPGAYDLVMFDETMEVSRLPQGLTVVAPEAPVVTSVTPGVLKFSREPQRLLHTRHRLSPSLKAAIGAAAATYTSDSPDRAEVMAPPLPPGTFDVILSDAVGELVRVPKAIMVPKPSIQRITPSLLEYSRENQRVQFTGQHLQVGLRMFVGWREVAPQFESPTTGEVELPPLPPGSYDVALFDPSGGTEYGRYRNAVTIRPTHVVELTLRVRFIVKPEVLAVVKQSEGEQSPPGTARLLSYQVGEQIVGTTRAELKEGPVVILQGTVRVPATRKPDGWYFDGKSLKAGGPFTLRTLNYQLDGEILSIELPTARAK